MTNMQTPNCTKLNKHQIEHRFDIGFANNRILGDRSECICMYGNIEKMSLLFGKIKTLTFKKKTFPDDYK